jgi:hypothetical protein
MHSLRSTNSFCDCEILSILTSHLCHCSRVNVATISTKEQQCAVNDICGLKVYQGQTCIADFLHNMETVLYCNEETMWKNGCTSVTDEKREVSCPYQLQRKTFNKSVSLFWITDGWLSMMWNIICTMDVVLLMETSKTDLGSIKFVQDGFQKTTHRRTHAQLFDNLPRPNEPLLQWRWCFFEIHCQWGWDMDPPFFSLALQAMIIFRDSRTPWMSDQLIARPLPKHRTK